MDNVIDNTDIYSKIPLNVLKSLIILQEGGIEAFNNLLNPDVNNKSALIEKISICLQAVLMGLYKAESECNIGN